MKITKHEFLVFGLIATVAVGLVLLKETKVEAFVPPLSPVTAASIQRWRVSNRYYSLSFFGDGTLLAAQGEAVEISGQPGSYGVNAVKLAPATGGTIGTVLAPNVRSSIRISNTDQDWMVGGYANSFALDKDGNYLRQLRDLGCCNSPKFPLALDHSRDVAFAHSGGDFFGLNMATGVTQYRVSVGDPFGMISIADPDTFYTSARNGNVVRFHPVNGITWRVNVGGNVDMQPGAVAADGSIIVSTGSAHFAGTTSPGRLARLTPTGGKPWDNMVNAVTPPIIGGNGLILVGTQPEPISETGPGAIEAYDPGTGSLVWSTLVEGLPNDLLVGDDGAVYAGTGPYGNGKVYVFSQDDGSIRKIVTDVPGAWEIVLRAGLLYASGFNQYNPADSSITALPVVANNYDPNSPWPVRYHDNQRTSNRTAPILNPSRLPPPPTPVLTPTPGPLCADSPSYTAGPHVPTPGTYQTGLALGDFNEDGNQDILFSNGTTNNVSLRIGDGNGSFSGSANFPAPDNPWRIVTADFNNDGNLDYAVAGNNSGLSHVRLGNGNGGFDSGTNYQMTMFAAFITTADFNGDGNTDLATSSGGNPDNGIQVAVRLGNGSGGFGPLISMPTGTVLSSIVSADLNGDGWPDLAVADFDDNKVALRLNDGNGGFVSGADVPVGNGAREIGIGDFNGDGKKDLAVTNELSNTISIRTGNGSGGFSALTELPAGNHSFALVVSDLDNDGDDDILQSDNYANTIGVILGDGSGGFAALPDLIGDVGTNVIAVGDFNNDGIKDFASANNQGWPDAARIWIGSCTLADSVAPSTTASRSALPNGAGWNSANVDVALTAEDNAGGSGVANISYSASGAQTIGATTVNSASANVTITAEGETTITYFAEDNAGNVESPNTLVIKIDKTAPTITVIAPTSGSYIFNQSVLADYMCSDAVSLVVSCVGTVSNGSALDTGSLGNKTFTVNSTDNAGNSSSTVVNYTVRYRVPTDRDECKTDGWQTLQRANGTLFDNQGDCVSYVNTGI